MIMDLLVCCISDSSSSSSCPCRVSGFEFSILVSRMAPMLPLQWRNLCSLVHTQDRFFFETIWSLVLRGARFFLFWFLGALVFLFVVVVYGANLVFEGLSLTIFKDLLAVWTASIMVLSFFWVGSLMSFRLLIILIITLHTCDAYRVSLETQTSEKGLPICCASAVQWSFSRVWCGDQSASRELFIMGGEILSLFLRDLNPWKLSKFCQEPIQCPLAEFAQCRFINLWALRRSFCGWSVCGWLCSAVHNPSWIGAAPGYEMLATRSWVQENCREGIQAAGTARSRCHRHARTVRLGLCRWSRAWAAFTLLSMDPQWHLQLLWPHLVSSLEIIRICFLHQDHSFLFSSLRCNQVINFLTHL